MRIILYLFNSFFFNKTGRVLRERVTALSTRARGGRTGLDKGGTRRDTGHSSEKRTLVTRVLYSSFPKGHPDTWCQKWAPTS